MKAIKIETEEDLRQWADFIAKQADYVPLHDHPKFKEAWEAARAWRCHVGSTTIREAVYIAMVKFLRPGLL